MSVFKKQDGFMLVEIVVAIIIISVALLAISSLFMQASRTVTDSGSNGKAVNYAQEKMEILKTYNSKQWTEEWSKFPTTTLKENYYSVCTTVANFPPNVAHPKLIKVTVTVSWMDKTIPRHVAYTSLYKK